MNSALSLQRNAPRAMGRHLHLHLHRLHRGDGVALRDGVANIPIEERDAAEVRCMSGKTAGGTLESVQICPDTTPARNWGFDVTPARLVTQLICERGLCEASEAGILSLFPEQA